MRHKFALFDEFSVAFQFPSHFGENWDAFYDCISDLQWLAPQGCIIAITEPEELLVDAQIDELIIFLETLKDTHARFTAPLEHDGLRPEPVPFHVVMISEDSENHRLDQWERILKRSFARTALPLRITRAECEPDPILLLSGPGWASNFSCDWILERNRQRIDRNYSDGNIPDDTEELTAQDLDFLIDRHIEAITSNAQMIDPVFHISGGIELRVDADTDIDPWVLGLPDITLVGTRN